MSENNEEKNKQSSFSKAVKNVGKFGAKTIAKTAAGLNISSPLAAIIIALLGGSSIFGIFFGFFGANRFDDSMNDPHWICESDELESLAAGVPAEDEDTQENINIMYDLFVNELGYSEEFLVGMVSCMMVESQAKAARIESDYMSAMRPSYEELMSICGPGTHADAATTLAAYIDYCHVYEYNGDWNGNENGYVLIIDGDRVVCCGIGLIGFTKGRAINLINGVDIVSQEYGAFDIQYQLAFMLAEFATDYPSLDINSSEYIEQGSDDAWCQKFFTTTVSGGSMANYDKRANWIPQVRQWVNAAAANAEYTSDITSMAELLADGDFSAAGAHNANSRQCINISQMSTKSISEAALSVAWLQGGHYMDDKHAEMAIPMSPHAPQIVNNYDFLDGVQTNTGDTIATHCTGGIVSLENFDIDNCNHGVHDMVACTRYYVLAHYIVLPTETGLNGQIGFFSSCDRGTAVPVRMSGSDDNFPGGNPQLQLAYMMGTERMAEDQDFWEPCGFLRGQNYYSFRGSTCMSADTVICTWDNHMFDGTATFHGSPIGSGTAQMITINGQSVPRFAPSSSCTHNHIITFVGVNNVRKYYGTSFLYEQWALYGGNADSLTSGDYNPDLEEDLGDYGKRMQAGVAYHNQYSQHGSDPMYTFYDGMADIAGGAVEPAHSNIRNRDDVIYNPKTGLPQYVTYDMVYASILAGSDVNTFSSGWAGIDINAWTDNNATNPMWRLQLAASMEYHALQFERFAMAAMMCNFATEDDMNIYQPGSKDAEILGNVYRNMTYNPNGQITYILYQHVTANDTLQDLAQLFINDGTPEGQAENERNYGLTTEDVAVLRHMIAGDIDEFADPYWVDMMSEPEEFEKAVRQWMINGYYSTATAQNGAYVHPQEPVSSLYNNYFAIMQASGTPEDRERYAHGYVGELYGIDPLAAVTTVSGGLSIPQQRLNIIDALYFCDPTCNEGVIRGYAVIDYNGDGRMSYIDFEGDSGLINGNTGLVGYECIRVYNDDIVFQYANVTGVNGQIRYGTPDWQGQQIFDNLLTAGGIKEYVLVDEYGRIMYSSTSGWIPVSPYSYNYDGTHNCENPSTCHHHSPDHNPPCVDWELKDKYVLDTAPAHWECEHILYDVESGNIGWHIDTFDGQTLPEYYGPQRYNYRYCDDPDNCTHSERHWVEQGGHYEADDVYHHCSDYCYHDLLINHYSGNSYTCTEGYTHCNVSNPSTRYYVIARVQEDAGMNMQQAIDHMTNGSTIPATGSNIMPDIMVPIFFNADGSVRSTYYEEMYRTARVDHSRKTSSTDGTGSNPAYADRYGITDETDTFIADIAYFDGDGYTIGGNVSDSTITGGEGYQVAVRCCSSPCYALRLASLRYRMANVTTYTFGSQVGTDGNGEPIYDTNPTSLIGASAIVGNMTVEDIPSQYDSNVGAAKSMAALNSSSLVGSICGNMMYYQTNFDPIEAYNPGSNPADPSNPSDPANPADPSNPSDPDDVTPGEDEGGDGSVAADFDPDHYVTHVFHILADGQQHDGDQWYLDRKTDTWVDITTVDDPNETYDGMPRYESLNSMDARYWVVHASRGSRGPKCAYWVNTPNMQYILFRSTTPSDYESQLVPQIENYNSLDQNSR